MILTRVTAPAQPLVSRDALKAHLRVRHDDENDLIDGLGAAAMAHIDGPRGVLGRCIQPQDWMAEFQPGEWCGHLVLPVAGVTSVTAAVASGSGAVDFIESERCDRGIWTEVRLEAPRDVAVQVRFSAASPEDIWPAVALAVKLLVGHWYLNRDAVVVGAGAVELPFAVDALLSPLKLQWV